jgi:uncharacterized protein YceH (UPF0502 family)
MLEKETTTPEQYPLSLNGLINACNQKSNRDPVMTLSEGDVQNIIDELIALNLVNDQGAFSGRVAKYAHRFCNTEFGALKLTQQQRAIICVLFLRGPQTPGELRTRTNRLADFSNVSEVESCLEALQELNEHKWVIKLAREPGKRDSRYAHLFMDQTHVISIEDNNVADLPEQLSLVTRVNTLEEKIESLEKKLAELLAELN